MALSETAIRELTGIAALNLPAESLFRLLERFGVRCDGPRIMAACGGGGKACEPFVDSPPAWQSDRRTLTAAVAGYARGVLRHETTGGGERESALIRLEALIRRRTGSDALFSALWQALLDGCGAPDDPNAETHRRILRHTMTSWERRTPDAD